MSLLFAARAGIELERPAAHSLGIEPSGLIFDDTGRD